MGVVVAVPDRRPLDLPPRSLALCRSACRPELAAPYHQHLAGGQLLSYDQVRDAQDPRITLLAFLQSTYAAGVRTAGWDREELTSSFCPSPAELQALQRATAP